MIVIKRMGIFFIPDLLLFSPVPDSTKLIFIPFGAIRADLALVSVSLLSNAKRLVKKESSEFSHSIFAKSQGLTLDLSYNKPSHWEIIF